MDNTNFNSRVDGPAVFCGVPKSSIPLAMAAYVMIDWEKVQKNFGMEKTAVLVMSLRSAETDAAVKGILETYGFKVVL